ncbi:hypothetical protein, partial [Massilia rhizosphaerae]|uniref:hypothetical protein n=1 Tax=Massilia rhizosphaerae TaxID=2784389 RepID=UPI001E4AC653
LDREQVRSFLFLGLFSAHHFGHGTVLSALFHDPGSHRKSDRLILSRRQNVYSAATKRLSKALGH